MPEERCKLGRSTRDLRLCAEPRPHAAPRHHSSKPQPPRHTGQRFGADLFCVSLWKVSTASETTRPDRPRSPCLWPRLRQSQRLLPCRNQEDIRSAEESRAELPKLCVCFRLRNAGAVRCRRRRLQPGRRGRAARCGNRPDPAAGFAHARGHPDRGRLPGRRSPPAANRAPRARRQDRPKPRSRLRERAQNIAVFPHQFLERLHLGCEVGIVRGQPVAAVWRGWKVRFRAASELGSVTPDKFLTIV